MAESSPDRCEYLWPEDFDRDDDPYPNHQSCCWRKTWREYDRCIWHVETDEEKPAEELKQDLEEPEDWGRNPDLRDAPLQPGELLDGASLAGADLSDVEPFFRCVLRHADLTDANLLGADLTDANLLRADLTDAVLRGADLSDADLRWANLSDVDFLAADLINAYLGHADLTDADLSRVDLTDAYLGGVDLTDADLHGADLSDADLRGADLTNADLRDADLTDADLRGADLTDAVLRGADLTDADLSRADLINAYLGSATLTDVELDQTTQVGRRCPRLRNASAYDELSQSYHELKNAFSDQGLSQRGRDVRFLEQVARRREARKRGQYLTWAGSILSLPDSDLVVGAVDDDTNYLITQLAHELGTAQIAAIVDDPQVLDLFEESGLDVVIHPEDIIAGKILQMVYQQRAERVSVLEHDNAEVFEIVVDKDRFWLEIPSAT